MNLELMRERVAQVRRRQLERGKGVLNARWTAPLSDSPQLLDAESQALLSQTAVLERWPLSVQRTVLQVALTAADWRAHPRIQLEDMQLAIALRARGL
jgi:predicted ATPase with chaperone activity